MVLETNIFLGVVTDIGYCKVQCILQEEFSNKLHK